MTARRQMLFWALGAAVALALLALLKGILLPFVAGMAVAYFLDPAVDRVERLGLVRWLATSVITLGFFVVGAAIVVLLFPLVQTQVALLIENMPAYVEKAQGVILPAIERVMAAVSAGGADRPAEAAKLFTENAGEILANVASRLVSSGLALFNMVSLIFITPIVTFYLLRDWDKIVKKVDSLLPRRHIKTIHEQIGLIDASLAGFLRGQALVCLVLAVLYGIGLSLAGLQFGLVIGLFTGFIAFIPYIGFAVGLAIALIFSVLQFGGDFVSIGLVVLVYAVLQVVESMALTPRLVGERVGLHPVWVIFSLLAAGILFGFVGIVLAVPAAAVAGVLVRFAAGRYVESALYLGHRTSGSETPPEDRER